MERLNEGTGAVCDAAFTWTGWVATPHVFLSGGTMEGLGSADGVDGQGVLCADDRRWIHHDKNPIVRRSRRRSGARSRGRLKLLGRVHDEN